LDEKSAMLCCATWATRESQEGLQHGDIDLNDLSGLHEVDGGSDSRSNPPQGRPVVRGEDHKSQITTRKVLLILDVLIARKRQMEPRLP